MRFFLRLTRTKLVRNESGQVLAFAAVVMVVLLGFVALVLDMGRLFFAQRELQSATDSAALAGAAELPSASAATIATQYSAVTGAVNAKSNLPNVTMISGYPKIKCLTTLTSLGEACSSPSNANSVTVAQQAPVKLYFAGLFGHPTQNVTAISTASAKGGSPTPYNVAIIVDTTLSMNQYDSDCGATQISCALNGVQILLQNLNPCAKNTNVCNVVGGKAQDSVDRVSLFTFPNVTTSTVAQDTNCTIPVPAPNSTNKYSYNSTIGNYVMPPALAWSEIPSAASYSYPTPGASSYLNGTGYTAVPQNGSASVTYQVTDFLSDYRVSNTAPSLNTASTLVQAVGGAPGCNGMAPANYAGVYGTFYAGALYAAQSALTYAKANNPGSQNVIILLSDGNATAPQNNGPYYAMGPPASAAGVYPSYTGQCGQAISAALYAAAAGTQVYSVANGSPSAGCTTDVSGGSNPGISPCNTMAAIASAPQYFYSDYKQSGSGSTCVSSQPVTSLAGIFTAISANLSSSRLIPIDTP